MRRPEPVPISENALVAIGARHGLRWDSVARLPSQGIINTVLGLGPKYVLRVPHSHPAHVKQALREAAAIPLAVAAGVGTAGLVAFDDSCELLPVPYLIVERVDGVDAESRPPDASAARQVWRETGADLARLHIGSASELTGELAETDDEFAFPDPRTLVDQRVRDGWISNVEGRWLTRWLDDLDVAGAAPGPGCLVHGDVQMSNVLVTNGRYLALIDWGCARIDDPAADFLAMPLTAIPSLLAGYREVAPLPGDESAEARILWRRLQMLLAVLPRGAAPGTTWAERPVTWLVDLLAFFADQPRIGPWMALRPPTQE